MPAALILLAAIALIFAYRLWGYSVLGLALHYDEAQYFGWSLALDWGYYSKPPMIAWAIGAARSICGDSESCVRAPAAIALFLSSIVMASIAWKLVANTRNADMRHARRAALTAGVAFATMPLVTFYSGFMTTDSLLILFWVLALYSFLSATQLTTVNRESLFWWVLTGLFAGLGLLSKYTMGVFAVSALIWLAIDKRRRTHLVRPQTWVGVVVAALVFTPNVLWNQAHGFATLSHTQDISRASEKAQGGIQGLAEFVFAQPFLLGIGFAMMLIPAWVWASQRNAQPSGLQPTGRIESTRQAFWFAFHFTWPILAIIALQATASRAHANWAATWIAGGVLMVSMWLSQTPRPRWTALSVFLNVAVASLVIHGPWLLQTTGLDDRLKRSPYQQMDGWKSLGNDVRAILAMSPGAKVLSNDRRILSEMIYYAGPQAHPGYAWNPDHRSSDHYQLLYDAAKRAAHSPEQLWLFVGRAGNFDEQRLVAQFSVAERVAILNHPLEGDSNAKQVIWRLSGWKPTTASEKVDAAAPLERE